MGTSIDPYRHCAFMRSYACCSNGHSALEPSQEILYFRDRKKVGDTHSYLPRRKLSRLSPQNEKTWQMTMSFVDPKQWPKTSRIKVDESSNRMVMADTRQLRLKLRGQKKNFAAGNYLLLLLLAPFANRKSQLQTLHRRAWRQNLELDDAMLARLLARNV